MNLKMLHATTLLIAGLVTATVNAQNVIAPIWTNVDVESCLIVKGAAYSNGSPLVLLVYLDYTQQF
jgi:hypothetical protein